MHDLTTLMLAGFAGLLLGAIFFGGLWWTVRMGMASARPAVWFFVSLLLRLGLVIAGFYFVGQDDWRRWVACLFGLITARILISRLTEIPAKEVLDEPHS